MNRVVTRRLVTRRLSTTAVATNLDDVATPKLICSDSGKFSCTILPGWSLFAGKGAGSNAHRPGVAWALRPGPRRLIRQILLGRPQALHLGVASATG